MQNNDYLEIVLTGGPCAGKSSALSHLVHELQNRGITCLCIPEVATMYIGGGAPIVELLQNEEAYVKAQTAMVQTQIALRENYQNLAQAIIDKDPDKKVVIISDRGLMDFKAYSSSRAWKKVVKNVDLGLSEMRDSYDAVIHLETAAKGAEKFYTKANNHARRENLEEAREADDRTLKSWLGHPRMWVVKNDGSFSDKLNRVTQIVSKEVSLPVPLEIERRFLLKPASLKKQVAVLQDNLGDKLQQVFLEDYYLGFKDKDETRIRRRSQIENDKEVSASYFLSKKTWISKLKRLESSSLLTRSQFLQFKNQKDKLKLEKTRYLFVYDNLYFELDYIKDKKLWLLQVELTEEHDQISLPPFLEIDKEITGMQKYTSLELAKQM